MSNWQKALESLANGVPIDWQHTDQESRPFKALRQLEKLQQQMKENLHADIGGKPASFTFQWGHLYALESVGTGSFGTVYKCHDSVLQRPVALKLLNQENVKSWQKNQFMEEARNMARVRSPHVLTIHGAAVHKGQVGFWCDFITGATLTHVSMGNDFNAAIAMMTALAQALTAVHETGLIHGDIKPGNVMRSDKGRYVLMDFGGSLLLNERDLASANWIGSPQYMAPELFDDQPKSQASDVYALGLVFYQQLTGLPLPAADSWESLKAQKRAPISWPNATRRIAKPWRHLITSMCHPDPAARPSAIEVQHNISQLQKLPERLRKRRTRWAIGTSLAAGLIISLIAIWQIDGAKRQVEAEKRISDQVNLYLQRLLNATSDLGRGEEVRMVEVIDAAARDLDRSMPDIPQSRAAIHHAIGNSYNSLRLPQKALPQLQQSLVLYRQWLGDQHAKTLAVQLELAFSHRLKLQMDKSEAMLHQVIALSLEQPKLFNINALAVIRLAKIRVAQDRNQEATLLLKPWLDWAESQQHSDSNLPQLIFNTLSDAYYNMGDFKNAENLALQALNWLQQYPNANPINVMAVRSRIAKSAERNGDLTLARDVFAQNLEDAKRFYGENTDDYIQSLVNYGAILQRTGDISASQNTKEKAWTLAREHLGMAHTTTIQAGMNFANVLSKKGQLHSAQQLLETLMPHSKTNFGIHHQTHLIMIYNLVELLNKQQLFDQAITLAEENVQVADEKLGQSHPLSLYFRTNLATTLAGLGQFDRAAATFAHVHSQLLQHHPQNAELAALNTRLQNQAEQWQTDNHRRWLID